MAVEFKFPDVGEGIHEGEVVKWLVKEGDRVQEHQALVQIQTDKAIVELPSPVTGVVLKLHQSEGANVKVGEVLATIGATGETVSKPQPKQMPVIPAQHDTLPAQRAEGKTQQALPSVRALAKQLGVDLSTIQGTGPGGAVTEKDIKQASEVKPATKAPTLAFEQYGKVLRIPLRGMRKAIARNMLTAKQHVPHVTHCDHADVTKLWEIRKEYKKQAEDQGYSLTFLPFIIKAVTIALKKHPFLNASLDEEKEDIVVKQYYNIGFAVDATEGLVVPVLKNADHMSIYEIAKHLQTLAEKARTGELTLDDMRGGSFTITNIGSIGGTFFTPIVNYPECAILGTGRIDDQAVVEDGVIVVRKILPLCLSFDHRVLDGAKAARFLNDVIQHLEDPRQMLMDAD